MMSELTRLKDEASRLLTLYEEYKNCNDEYMRRKVHIDLDRFLMEHREVAAVLMVQGLQSAFEDLVKMDKAAKKLPKQIPWYKRLLGGNRHADSKNQVYKGSVHS